MVMMDVVSQLPTGRGGGWLTHLHYGLSLQNDEINVLPLFGTWNLPAGGLMAQVGHYAPGSALAQNPILRMGYVLY